MSATPIPARAAEGQEALWNAIRSTLRSHRDGVPLERTSRDAPIPASFAQEGGWIRERLLPGCSLHNLAVALQMTGSLNTQCLERSFEALVERHEILRTTLRFVDGQLFQIIHPPARFAMTVTDLSGIDAARRETEVRHQCVEEAHSPFDIGRAPLMRARLFKLGEGNHLVVLTLHHLAFDGWSFEPFMRELSAIYSAYIGGLPSPLPNHPLQYADWAVWQRLRMNDEAIAPLLLYWKDQLSAPASVLALPCDRLRKANNSTPEIGRHPFVLSKELTATLKLLSAEVGATPFVILLAAFQVLLYRQTGEEDILVASPIANRNRIELEDMVGLFVNTLVLRVGLGDRPSFRDLLVRVRDIVFDAYRHQELPFELLVQSLGLERSRTSPLLQVMFAFQNLPKSRWEFPELIVEGEELLNGTAHSDLALFIKEDAECFSGTFEFDVTLFDSITVARIADHFLVLLQGIAQDPGRSIASIPLISAGEKAWLLERGTGTAENYPKSAVHDVFQAQARRMPSATAIVSQDTMITYTELDQQANRLANYLTNFGVRPGDLVGLCLDPSPLRIASMLAVLKCGAAYVPIDPAVPRVPSGMPSLVVLTRGRSEPAIQSKRILNLDDAAQEISHQSSEYSAAVVDAESVAYVMLTSGSTGIPKGVCIPHRAIVRLVCGTNYVDIARHDVFLQLASACFDASTFEIWGALLNGAKLVVPSQQMSLGEISQAIRRYKVSIAFLTSRLFELMVEMQLDSLSSIRQVLVGGDVLSVRHAERFARHAAESRLIHCYGPTENTTFSTFYKVSTGEMFPDGTVPIGQPISNTQIYVLDPLQQPAPIGVVGEVYLGGDGLMKGYLHDAEPNREQMIASPFGRPGSLLYRSGDRARFRSDGMIVFHGRTDEQVKIRGFRVEPGEVESVLSRCPLVKNTVIVARKNPGDDVRLIAFVVLRSGSSVKSHVASDVVSDIRRFLRARLPRYLVPVEFVLMDSLPLNANGKVDRKALRIPAGTQNHATLRFIPRDRFEKLVWEQFTRVLGVSHVGPDDSFFDVGGDSLLALRLLVAIEEVLGVSPPLVSFFGHPTVMEFAGVLRNSAEFSRPGKARSDSSGAIEIKSGRAAIPLFVVPGGSGGKTEMALFATMMCHLSGERRVYGLRADSEEPDATIETRAAACVAEMRRLQPHGPYFVGGECVGGIVAFEVAQQLRSQGEEVPVLVLFDAWLPSMKMPVRAGGIGRMAAMLASVKSVLRLGMDNVRREMNRTMRPEQARHATRWIDGVTTLKRKCLSAARNLPYIVNAARRAASRVDEMARYRAATYRGPITLIVSEQWKRLDVPGHWEHVAGDKLIVHTLPGSHESYIRNSPERAARLLERCLEQIHEVVL